MILQLGLKPKIPDQRNQLDCSEYMFRNKPGHIVGNKWKQEPDANYSFVPSERKGKLAFRSKVLLRVHMFRVFERS